MVDHISNNAGTVIAPQLRGGGALTELDREILARQAKREKAGLVPASGLLKRTAGRDSSGSDIGIEMEMSDEEFNEKFPSIETMSVADYQNRKAGQSSILTEWENEPSVEDLKKDFRNCLPHHQAQMEKIQHWQRLREGGAPVKAGRNRSKVRSKLIRRQAEWRYSALTEPFLGENSLYRINPRTFEDTTAAKQNELLLNWQFDTQINKEALIDEYVQVTVDEGTSILRVGWERQTHTVKRTVPVWRYVRLDRNYPPHEAFIDQLNQAIQLREKNPRGFEELPEALIASVEFSEANGVLAGAIQIGTEEREEEEILVNRPTVEVMNPNNVYLDPSCNGNPEKARFIIHSFETSKAELLKSPNYTNLRNFSWGTSEKSTDTEHETGTPDSFNFEDDLRKRVIAYEWWGLYDIHGDNNLVPIVATWLGDRMIRMELNPYPDKKHPFIFTRYLPIKRSSYGETDAELLEDNQAISGAVMRGAIDLMGRAANSQQGMAKGMLDVVNRRRFENGQHYEFNPNVDVKAGYHQHKYPEIPNSVITMLNMQNNEAEGLTGVRAFSGGLSGKALGDTRIEQKNALDAPAKREMAILRRMSAAWREVGQKIASMNALLLSDEEVVRVTNEKYVTIKREDLRGQFDLIVTINTPEVEEKKAQDMAFMLQTLGPTTPLPFTQMILADIARLKKMPELAQQIASYVPEPDPIEEAKRELELAELQEKIQETRSRTELNKAKTQEALADAQKTEIENVNETVGVNHAREMEKQSEQARGNQDLAITKSLVTPLKEGEKEPDYEAAFGFNELTKELANADRNISLGT